MNDELASAVRKTVRRYLAQTPAARKWGRVEATVPLTVRFPGDTAGTEVSVKAAGYVPTVGDVVVVERVGSTWVAAYAIEDI